jgi:glucokinase
VVADALGAEITRTTVRTPRNGARAAVRRIADEVLKALEQAHVPRELVATVGVCLPGLVAADRGVLLLAPNLGWRKVPVAALLEEMLGIPVSAHNASQTTLVAEVTEGAAAGDSDVLLLYAGSGIGGAAWSSGRLVVGDQGLAGEVGHCRMVDDGERCGCGGTGCLETVASAQAVVDAVSRRWIAEGRSAPADFGEVAAAAAEGDVAAREQLALAARYLGRAASWLVNVLAPRTLVLAGGMLDAGEAFVAPFRETVLAEALPVVVGRLRLRESTLGQDAEVRGVLLLARERASAGPRVVSTS